MTTFTLIKCASHNPLSLSQNPKSPGLLCRYVLLFSLVISVLVSDHFRQIQIHLVSSVHVLVSAQVLARSVAPLVVIITIMSGFLWLDHYNQHHQFTLNIILIVKR